MTRIVVYGTLVLMFITVFLGFIIGVNDADAKPKKTYSVYAVETDDKGDTGWAPLKLEQDIKLFCYNGTAFTPCIVIGVTDDKGAIGLSATELEKPAVKPDKDDQSMQDAKVIKGQQ